VTITLFKTTGISGNAASKSAFVGYFLLANRFDPSYTHTKVGFYPLKCLQTLNDFTILLVPRKSASASLIHCKTMAIN
jgi:hypothetical protein